MKNSIKIYVLLIISFCFIACSSFKGGSKNTQSIMQNLYSATWKLISINSESAEVISPPEDRITIEFSPEGTVSGKGGCNRYNGKYEIDGNNLKISDVFSTRMACEILNIENVMFKELRDVNKWEIKNNTLLLKKDKQILLTFGK